MQERKQDKSFYPLYQPIIKSMNSHEPTKANKYNMSSNSLTLWSQLQGNKPFQPVKFHDNRSIHLHSHPSSTIFLKALKMSYIGSSWERSFYTRSRYLICKLEDLRAIWPDHCHLNFLIIKAISIISNYYYIRIHNESVYKAKNSSLEY